MLFDRLTSAETHGDAIAKVKTPKQPGLKINVLTALQKDLEVAPRPEAGRIFRLFVHRLGGEKGFVEEVIKEYAAAKPGTMIRQRIMDMMIRFGRVAEEVGIEEEKQLLPEGQEEGGEGKAATGDVEEGTGKDAGGAGRPDWVD